MVGRPLDSLAMHRCNLDDSSLQSADSTHDVHCMASNQGHLWGMKRADLKMVMRSMISRSTHACRLVKRIDSILWCWLLMSKKYYQILRF